MKRYRDWWKIGNTKGLWMPNNRESVLYYEEKQVEK